MDNISHVDELWDKEYKKGYGNQWPNSSMITAYHRYIKPHIKTNNPKVLDFGCGIGKILVFLMNLGLKFMELIFQRKL